VYVDYIVSYISLWG